jgi:hypothetical protein
MKSDILIPENLQSLSDTVERRSVQHRNVTINCLDRKLSGFM